MMGNVTPGVKTKEFYQRELTISRGNMLLAAALTVFNLIMIVVQSDMIFFFSASLPVYLSLFFAELCGMRSAEFYAYNYGENWKSTLSFESPGIFWTIFVISLLIALSFVLLWWLSKKKRVWSVVTLVFYVIDSVALLFFGFLVYSFSATTLLEILFHAWLIYYAVRGVKAWNGVETAPTAAEVAAQMGIPYGNQPYGVNPYGQPIDPMSNQPVPANDEQPAEATPTEEMVSEETPLDDAVAEETPADETPEVPDEESVE